MDRISYQCPKLKDQSIRQQGVEKYNSGPIRFSKDGKDYKVTLKTFVGKTFENYKSDVVINGRFYEGKGPKKLVGATINITDKTGFFGKKEVDGYVSKDGKVYIPSSGDLPKNGGIKTGEIWAGNVYDRGNFDLLGRAPKEEMGEAVKDLDKRAMAEKKEMYAYEQSEAAEAKKEDQEGDAEKVGDTKPKKTEKKKGSGGGFMENLRNYGQGNLHR